MPKLVCDMPGCAQPLPDLAVICYGCTAKLISALKSIPDLMNDLAVTLEKRSKTVTPSGPTGTPEIDPVKMPFNLAASHAKAELLGVLLSWAALVRDTRTVRSESYDNHGAHVITTGTLLNCELTCTALSGWLLQYMGWIRHYEAAPDCVMEIRDAVNMCLRVIDAPVPKRFIGMCDYCGASLWIDEYDDDVTCTMCLNTWNVRERQRANLDLASDFVTYREQCAMAMTANGCNLTSDLLKKWQQRGLLEVRRLDARGRKMYRIGDVKDLWDKHNERKLK